MSSRICQRCRKPHTEKGKYCPECKPAAPKQQSKEKLPIYGTARWQKVRAKKLSLNPLCEYCADKGEVTPAAMVDHIIELKDDGEPFNLANLKSLCWPCHGRKTAREKNRRDGFNFY